MVTENDGHRFLTFSVENRVWGSETEPKHSRKILYGLEYTGYCALVLCLLLQEVLLMQWTKECA
jgi:hypothetical protein